MLIPGSCTALDIIDCRSRQHSQLERDRELSRCFFGRVCWTNQRKAKILSTKRKKKETREKLAVDWSSYPAADRTNCIESIKWFEPTYTELAACLEDVQRREETQRKRGHTE